MAGTEKQRDHDEIAREVLATARSYRGLGLHLVPVGWDKRPTMNKGYKETLTPAEVTDAAVAKISSGEAPGLGLWRGIRSATPRDQGLRVIGALELEGRAATDPTFLTEWKAAVSAVDAGKIMEILDSGWVEDTPSGGVRWFFSIQVETAAEWNELVAQVPVKACKRDGQTFAELLIADGFAVVAPSPGHMHKSGRPWTLRTGGPDSLPDLRPRDLFPLADALRETSDLDSTDTEVSGSVLPDQDAHTAEIRASYNRTTTRRTVELLTKHGWAVVSEPRDGGCEVRMGWARDLPTPAGASMMVGGDKRPAGSAYQFSSSHSAVGQGPHSAFDLLARLEWAGDGAALADHLESTRAVILKPRLLMACNRVEVYPQTESTERLTRKLANALLDADHPTAPEVPFVVVAVGPDGAPLHPVSMDANGAIQVWPPRMWETLLLSVAQPQRKAAKLGVITVEHQLPRAVVGMAVTAAMNAGRSHAKHVADSPVVTTEGKVVSNSGYHSREQALICIPHAQRAGWGQGYHVPPQPTRDQAQKALDTLLLECLDDFPFATAGDKARAVAYFLTLASRALYPTAPGFLFDAPDRGSGKSKLARLPRLIASGSLRGMSVSPLARDDEENRKAIVTAVLTGIPYLHVDELGRGGKITSVEMQEHLTSDDGAASKRVLGGHDYVNVGGLIWSVCGNNVGAGGDHNRRFVPIRLQHKGSTLPHERGGFRHPNLEGWVREHRPQLLAALHTMLVYGIQHPADHTPDVGSFEGWSRVVLGAMTPLILDGRSAADWVVDGRAEWTAGQDELSDDWGELLAWWAANLPAQWTALTDVHQRATTGQHRPDLPADLCLQTGQSDTGQVKAWGLALRTIEDTAIVHAGNLHRLRIKKNAKRGNRYMVEVTARGVPDGDTSEMETPTVSSPTTPSESVVNPAPTRVATPRPPTPTPVVAPAGSDEIDLVIA